jgi:hypothetical protein
MCLFYFYLVTEIQEGKNNIQPLSRCRRNRWTKENKKGIYLWKESLNSDGQQFHQYQQNEEPLNKNKKKKTTTYAEIKVFFLWSADFFFF